MSGNIDYYVSISALQAFSYCRRKFVLEYLEGLWEDNIYTTEGAIQHKNVHDYNRTESRNNLLITRALSVVSEKHHLVGICDVVEFYKSKDGIVLQNKPGYWQPIPIEYKHSNKGIEGSIIQLCAQAMCLEEMLGCQIDYGFLFYKNTKQREKIEFTVELRNKVRSMTSEILKYVISKEAPKVRSSKKCTNCTIKQLCLPKILNTDVTTYIKENINEKTS